LTGPKALPFFEVSTRGGAVDLWSCLNFAGSLMGHA